MKNNYRDNYYGSILDPLHGDIKLSEIEKWCIAQPIFSRLRNVKQNTFLYYVFPSANHTRFEHSIGVMHLAGKIFDACRENYTTGLKKKQKNKEDTESDFFNLDNLGNEEEVYYQELRLAALLHDLGHGPLSHLFDKFAIDKTNFLEIVKTDLVLKPYSTGFKKLIVQNKNKVEHEIISCAFIFILIHRLKNEAESNPNKFSKSAKKLIRELNAERVVKLVEPLFEGLPEIEDEKKNNYTLFFSRIITAFPLDADRMDYLWRDSYFSGVTYGIYDINRLFASFIAAKKGNKVLLTYKDSGLDAMLRFIQSRSHLYNQVYFHKTNRAANTMLEYATTTGQVANVKVLGKNNTSINGLIDFYIQNGDVSFLKETVKKELVKDKIEKEVLAELVGRKLFKRIFEIKIVLEPGQFVKKNKTKINQKDEIDKIRKNIDKKLKALKAANIYAASDKYENETFKEWNKKPISIAKKEADGYVIVDNWNTIGKEFRFANMSVVMVRVYLKRDFTSSEDFEKKKESIYGSIKNELQQLKNMAG